jgi:bifunctional non-homologous end joining protein LigD
MHLILMKCFFAVYFWVFKKRNWRYILFNDKATLLTSANLGCIELNPWHSTIQFDKPDYMIVCGAEKKIILIRLLKRPMHLKVLDRCKKFCKTWALQGYIFMYQWKKYWKTFSIYCVYDGLQGNVTDFTTMERNLKKRGNKKIYLD